jgi:hypothetical protein
MRTRLWAELAFLSQKVWEIAGFYRSSGKSQAAD